MPAITAWLEDIARELPLLLLVAARIGPVVVVTPFFSTRGGPATLRLALLLALTLVFAPIARAHATLPTGPAGLYALRELAIGTAWAIAVAVPFHAMDVAGRLADLARGASLAEVIAPTTGDRTSPLGDLLSLAAVAAFFALGGHRAAMLGLAASLEQAPIGALSADGRFGVEAARIVASSLTLGVALALPVLVTLVVVEIGLGLVARASPRVQVFFIGMPLRAGLGLAVLALVLGRAIRALPDTIRGAIADAGALLGG